MINTTKPLFGGVMIAVRRAQARAFLIAMQNAGELSHRGHAQLSNKADLIDESSSSEARTHSCSRPFTMSAGE